MTDPFENFHSLRLLSDEKLKSLAAKFGHDAGSIRQVVRRMRDLWNLQLAKIEVESGLGQRKASTTRQAYLDEKYIASITEYSDLVEISIQKRILFETSHLLLKARQSSRRYHAIERRISPSKQKESAESLPSRELKS